MKNIILNTNNVVPGTNNSKFEYFFPSTVEFKDDQIAVANISLGLSWDNIKAAYNNNYYSYVWYDALGASTHQVLMPDGIYGIGTINAFLQYTMIQNGHYLVDGNGDYVYYLEIIPNTVYFGNELRCGVIPTALPAGWTNPAGLTFPAVATTPQFIIPSTNFQTLLGFPAATYPPAPQATFYSVLGSPDQAITPVTTLNILCSLVNNRLQYPNNIVDSFTPVSGATGGQSSVGGSPINIAPYEFIFTDVNDGFYSSFTIEFVNQDYKPVEIQDPQVFIQLLFKKRGDVVWKK